jgi:glycosyltransferase involved in cell wall biosynthesis
VRLLHVITGLGTGGAETALARLVEGTAGAVQQRVVALGPDGPIAASLAARVPVETLGASSVGGLPSAIARLRTIVAEWRPDVLQGWMYHGNVVATLAARGRPVLWGVRQCLTSLADERPGTRLAILGGVPLSRRARRIMYNSALSAVQHERLGYAGARRLVLPNGFDTAQFGPDAEARRRVRAALGIPAEAVVLVHLARAHPVKDHAGLAAAVVPLLSQRPALHVLLAGNGVDASYAPLAPLRGHVRVHLLGERADVPALLAASDVLCLTSRAEAFPNVVGEAMASGLVVVTTEVGDVKALVGDDGLLVPPGDVAALAEALARATGMEPARRRDIGSRLRARIDERFTLRAMCDGFVGAWGDALAETRRA